MLTGLVFLPLSLKGPEKGRTACAESVGIVMMVGDVADLQPEVKTVLLDRISAMHKPQLGALTTSIMLALSQGDTDFSRPLPGDSS